MDVPFDPTLQPPPSLAIRECEFRAWLKNARPRGRIEYHRGCLTYDRTRGLSPFGEKFRRELDVIADRVLALAEEGRLLVVQERHGDGDYGYFAIKPRRPAPTQRPA